MSYSIPMKEYNINPTGQKYYRQNNNQIKPTIRCKPTATVEGLDLADWPLPAGGYKQPEDNLTAMMETTYGPNAPEEWDLIRMAVNGHFLPGPKPVIGPRWDWDIREALFGITCGKPFVCSTWLTKEGHVVNIIGFVTTDDTIPLQWKALNLDAVTEILIDDPYGDRTSGKYETSKTGHKNRYPADFFIKTLWRGTGIQIRRNA